MKNIVFSLIVSFCALVCGAQAAEEKVLRIYNFSDYIAESVVKDFEKETGIKVIYDVYDSYEVLETKLLAGKTGYDLVFPSGNFVQRFIQAGVLKKLDTSKLSNLKNLREDYLKQTKDYDPNNEYSLPYMTGTTGIGYNKKLVEKHFPDAPIGSLDLIFKPENLKKLHACGVSFLDSPAELFPMALHYLGREPYSTKKEDIDAAAALLQSIRPYVTKFHSSQYINDLANGDVCLAIGWSGDVIMAQDRATEAKNGVEIEYFVPKEGTERWFDMVAMPVDAPHPENAHLFINYLLRPEVIAAITNEISYENPNKAALEFVDESIRKNANIYVTEEVNKKLFPMKAYAPEVQRTLNRLWVRIKSGK